MPEPTQPLPWRLNDLMVVYLLNAVGFGALLTAWYGAGGTVRDDRQIHWLILAIAALIVIGTANFLWLLAGRSAVSARKRSVLAPLAALAPAGSPDGVVEPDQGQLVIAPGMVRYHLPSCQLVAGKPLRTVTPAQLRRSGLLPCGICAP